MIFFPIQIIREAWCAAIHGVEKSRTWVSDWTELISERAGTEKAVKYSQSYGFSSSHVQMWELDLKEAWALKNWHFQVVVREKTLESPLDSKEIKSINPKWNQPWIFIGGTDAEAETPIL